MVLEERQNIAIHGYHNKEENSYSIMDSNLPLLVDEKFSPFLITKGFHYTISTNEIFELLRNYAKTEKFNKNKRIFANLLIVPGLLFALMYIAQAVGLLSAIPMLYTLSQSWVADFAFWLAMFGVIILWHEYFRHKTHPVKLPLTERFTEREINTIKIMGVKFGLYKKVAARHFLSEETKELLYMNCQISKRKQEVDTFELFTTLLELEEIQELLKRADIKINKKDFADLKITAETFPKFPVASLRSLIIYSLEEAVITESKNIQPLHIFVGMVRVYPALRKILREHGSNLEILRETASYIAQMEPQKSVFSPFNINNAYYKTGGIGHTWIYRFPEKSKQYIRDVTVDVAHERERYGIAQMESVTELISVLERQDSRNKALLIGSTGVGKSSVIKALAQMITWGKAPETLLGYRVVKIGSDFIINNTPKISSQYFAQLLKSIEADRKTIFYIDNLLQILLPLSNRKTLNETQNLLQQFIIKSPSPIVSTMHYHDYQRYLKERGEIGDRFTNIEIPVVSQSETIAVLKEKLENIERDNGVYITIPALINIVELSTQKESPYKLPKLAVDLLNTIIKESKAQGIRVIKPQDVEIFGPKLFIEHREEQPINELLPEKDIILKPNLLTPSEAADKMILQNKIKSQIIGRNETLEKILHTMHSREQQEGHNSLGRFMMVGPSGTGKTYMSRIIAKEYFGSHKNFIHIDLSEMRYAADIQKLLMANSLPIEDSRDLQFRGVILIDYIEELNPATGSLIYDLLNTGEVQGQYRRKIDLSQSLVIVTSRIGEEAILTAANEDEALIEDSKRRATLTIRQKISAELLNTFDEIFIFEPYRIDELAKIAEKELERLSVIFLKNSFDLEWEPGVPQVLANSLKRGDVELINLRQKINELSQDALGTFTQNNNKGSNEIRITVNMVN